MAFKMAVRAWDVLEGAEVHDTLGEALRGTDLVFATTARRGRKGLLDSRQAAQKAVEQAALGRQIAVVMGTEKTGLSLADLQLCPYSIRIPMAADQPSINLAQTCLGTARRGVTQLAAEQLQNARASFTQWAEKFGINLRLQGWQVLRDGIGQWVDVEETPTAPAEQLFRLYPLIPDPRNTSHSARGRTIYFGTVPTGSADTDEFGKARFDDITQYEIRCYVRRHKPQCPKSSQKPDCHGELIWSLPGEPYQLAAHFDLVGTSNRAVSMQLPDLAALEAQAAARAPNQLAPFRMVSPPDSNLEFDADDSGNASNPHKSSQICSFSIPLITIVATFVFKLFLPVVTLLFGLFFLLKLKFCIPPSIELSAGVAAELNATLQLGLDISVDAKLAIGTPLGNAIDAGVNAGLGGDLAAGLKTDFGPRVIGQLANDTYQSGQQQNAPSLTAKLEYEDIVQAEVRI
jgi:hypothetical protein